ncbi:MAG: hypothetical protein ABL997_16005 [Planctomycetota bacterium]
MSQKDARRPLDEFALEQALREHCVKADLDPGYVLFAMQHRRLPDDDWRWCCGSNCDPCVDVLGKLVDLARRLDGLLPDGSEPKP